MATPVTGQGGLANLQKGLANVGQIGYGTATPTPLPLLVGRIIQAFLGLLGVIFLGLTIYGGYRWMMARGNEQEVDKAKETIKAGVIGLAIMLSGYAISSFVVSNLTNETLAP